jgi:hypothetical protein
MAIGASAGAAMMSDDHVEDCYAGDEHRQHWYEPKLHTHIFASVVVVLVCARYAGL